MLGDDGSAASASAAVTFNAFIGGDLDGEAGKLCRDRVGRASAWPYIRDRWTWGSRLRHCPVDQAPGAGLYAGAGWRGRRLTSRTLVILSLLFSTWKAKRRGCDTEARKRKEFSAVHSRL